MKRKRTAMSQITAYGRSIVDPGIVNWFKKMRKKLNQSLKFSWENKFENLEKFCKMSNLIFIFYESKKWPIKGVYQNIIKKCFEVRAQSTAFEKFSKLILLNMA